MPPNPEQISPTAIWSAIAASFSALSALVMLWIQHRNWIEAVRPELVLIDWERVRYSEAIAPESVFFKKIRNIGKGAAFDISYTSCVVYKNTPIAGLPSTHIPIIGAGETTEVASEIHIHWMDIPDVGVGKYLDFPFSIVYSDGRSMRYETSYTLTIFEDQRQVGNVINLAPGVALLFRNTRSRPLWYLSLRRTVERTIRQTLNRLRK